MSGLQLPEASKNKYTGSGIRRAGHIRTDRQTCGSLRPSIAKLRLLSLRVVLCNFNYVRSQPKALNLDLRLKFCRAVLLRAWVVTMWMKVAMS